MHLEDEQSSDGYSSVCLFAKHFSSVYSDENCAVRNYKSNTVMDLNCFHISVQDVYEGICQLKSKLSFGPDGLPAFLLKNCVSTLAKPLHFLFSLSLRTSTFPNYWKNSFITPIHKSEDKEDVKNYRGVVQFNLKYLNSLIS